MHSQPKRVGITHFALTYFSSSFGGLPRFFGLASVFGFVL
jgi:hypothetical protein